MLTIYGRATSSNVQLVMWTVAELGLAHERLDYGHVHGGLDTPEFRALNPHGKVPVLRDGATVVWESMAIARYLAARHGDGGAFWPADPAARAAVDMWAEYGKNELAQAFTMPIFWARVRTPEAARDKPALAAAVTRFDALLGPVADRLESHPFVAGGDFTLADIVTGHLLFRWFSLDLPRPDRPAIAAYYDRLQARPAYRTHVMVPFDTLWAEGA